MEFVASSLSVSLELLSFFLSFVLSFFASVYLALVHSLLVDIHPCASCMTKGFPGISQTI